jgi:hypothetical protein
MSAKVMDAVLNHSTSELSCRLVMVVLAYRASEDGVAWPSQVDIAARARTTDRTVRTCLRDLEAGGEVETRKARKGRISFNVYRVTLPGVEDVDYRRLAEHGVRLAMPFTTGTDFRSSTCHAVADDDRKSTTRRPEIYDRDDRKSDAENAAPYVLEPSREPPQSRTARPRPRAEDVLRLFNTRVGSGYPASERWLRTIRERVTEYPCLTLTDHDAVIAAALAGRWWDGNTYPTHLYGNGGDFEVALHAAGLQHLIGCNPDDDELPDALHATAAGSARDWLLAQREAALTEHAFFARLAEGTGDAA